MTTLTIDGETVELTDDGHGLAGHIVIDGIVHRIHATVTPSRPAARTPAQYCARRN